MWLAPPTSSRAWQDDDDDDDGDGEPALRLEMVEQPPVKCIYRRNLKPAPSVRVRGPAAGNRCVSCCLLLVAHRRPRDKRLFVGLHVVRCDTMEELSDDGALAGDVLERVAPGDAATFARVKLLHTSHQLNDTHFSLRFELRRYDDGDRYQVLHTLQSVPFLVWAAPLAAADRT